MVLHEQIATAYFAYLAIVAVAMRRRLTVLTLTSLVAIAAIAFVARMGEPLRPWWPAVSILAGYWASGLMFERPMTRVEEWLLKTDERALGRSGLLERLARAPRLLLEYLEGVYFGCFLLIPGGLAVLFWTGHPDAADRYWTAVVVAEFGAFAVLPWIQTRPPWALEPAGPLARRGLLLGRAARLMVDYATIGVNTFPSAHAAASLAAALAVLDAAPLAGSILLVLAVSIIVASVAGRYHYTADAASGIVLALLAWLLARAWA